MKPFLLSLASLLIAGRLFAQDDVPYADKAAQLQKEIWGTDVPEFKATAIPADLSKESAIILARSYNSQRTSHGRVKFMIITAGVTTRTVHLNTLHERVKINDKPALQSFSTLEYQKKLDKTVSLLVTKIVNINNTFVGVKIIKPDGKEIIVNTDEEVLTKNETKDQHGKLAIPGLQVGDILDYYISNLSIAENPKTDGYKYNDDIFMLADEYPVLYYSIDFQFNKKVRAKYIYGNGAPQFVETHNDAGDLLLSLKMRNLSKYQSQLWTSPFRQYPYIEIGSSFSSGFGDFVEGNSKINPKFTMFQNNRLDFEKEFTEYTDFDDAEKKLKDYFKSSKALKNAPLDSSMKVLYDEWKFKVFCTYRGNELENVNEMNYRNANNKFATETMAMILTDMDINYDVLLVASRNSCALENGYSASDFDAMIRINGPTPLYMAFDDIITHFNEIPARFQGEAVSVMHAKRHNSLKYSFTYSDGVLPVTASDKNVLEDRLQVNLLPANMQKLKIDRVTRETGSMRHDDQKLLVPVKDIDDGYMAMVNGETLAKRLSRIKETKKMLDDYVYSFNQEHDQMSKNFAAEIKQHFAREPQQLSNFKIDEPALENTHPVFGYSSSFVLDNLVKKAGNNFIIDAGKLTGDFLKLDEKDEKRDVDVYMPSARSFKYIISIVIPDGYNAKGVEELNQKKTNKTGSFMSSASIVGNTLTITVNRVYNNNFEKAADWPLLKDIINTASAFNDQKILLEKKG